LGTLLISALLYILPPQDCLRVVAGLGVTAASLAVWAGKRRQWAAGIAALAVISAALWPSSWLELRPSPYKGMSIALTVPGARVLTERSNPIANITVVESPVIPFRHAPGLSLSAAAEPPPQLGMFTDADGLSTITHFTGDRSALSYLDQQTAPLPYHLLKRPRTLVLGAGGGADVLRALYHEAPYIDAVELNPNLIDLVRGEFSGFAGHIHERPDVMVHVGEARSFVEASGGRWDLIQLPLLDSFTAASAGVQALSESPLYTVEGLQAYHGHLAPGGLLAITRWLRSPPRESVKLFATAVLALERAGASSPGDQLALIHGWNTATLLVKNGIFEAGEIATVRMFTEARSFDLAWYPGMSAWEANRFNRQAEPYLYRAAAALVGPERDNFLTNYKFHVAPATDDRPYFFRFFKWELLPELVSLRDQGGLAQADVGYLVVLMTLMQSVLASFVLILLPLFVLRPSSRAEQKAMPHWRVAVYFLSLGFGFIFIEISFIQRFTLFLGHPLAAIAVVLAAFLVCAGIGSGLCLRLRTSETVLAAAAAAIVTFATAYLLALPLLETALLAAPFAAKVIITLLLIAPLGVAMGVPFPLGLVAVASEAPRLVPWAWGINGCASVVGAVLASILAMHIGFSLVVCLAISL